MDNENFSQFIEKLKLQVTSFQEEFSILSQSENLDDMARNFHHILRGNLLINDVNFFIAPKKTGFQIIFTIPKVLIYWIN